MRGEGANRRHAILKPGDPAEGVTKLVTAGAVGAFGTWVGNVAGADVVLNGRTVAEGMSRRGLTVLEGYIGFTRGMVTGTLINGIFENDVSLTSASAVK